MKTTTVLFTLVLSAVLLIGDLPSQTFSYLPSKPQLNRKITITYNPTGGRLERATTIEAIAYQFNERSFEPTAIELTLTKRHPNWTATFIPDTSARAIFVSFHGDEKKDNGDPEGYCILLHDARGNYLPGTMAARAQAYFIGVQLLGMKRNPKLALENLEQEFALFPNQKARLLNLYWQLIIATDKSDGEARVLAQADSLAAKGDLTLDEKKLLANWYGFQLQQPEKAETLKDEIRAADPFGPFVQSERFQAFYAAQDINAKLAQFEQFKKDFPQSERIADMQMIILSAYLRSQQYEEARSFLESKVSKPSSMLYNQLAWDMVEKDIDVKAAAEIAKQGVELARKELVSTSTEKPKYLTMKQWLQSRRNSLGYVLDTYAYALHKLDRIEESVPLFAEAVQLTQQSNRDINERYANALIAIGNYQQAYDFLNELLRSGKSSPAIEESFKKAYVQVKGSEVGLTEYFSALKASGADKIKTKLQDEMLNQAAPDFELTDLAGNSISLKSLRGKIVVLDFWATWCGPCLASFPGMQQAVEKFRDDSQVEFLFVNTWERGDDVQQRVADFIREKNYPFHVLLDSKNEVVTAYGVEGIPTKFVIDKNGKIRFKSVGFGGDANQMVDELSMMIEMVR